MERLEVRAVPASYTAASVTDLVAAINAANATPRRTRSRWPPGKTFTLTAVNNTTDGPTGLPVIAAGEDLTIVGNGDVIERSTATGTPAFRLFDVAAGASLSLQNLTLQGGLALGDPYTTPLPRAEGGAIFNRGTLTLHGVTVQNNSARGPDASLPYPGVPGGPAAGGGVYSEGMLTIDGSTIRGNSAIGGKGADGVVYTDPIREYPGAPGGYGHGGGVSIGGGTVSISNSSITANIARGGDGGRGASAKVGGATYRTAGGNGGDGLGGALYAAGGTIALVNCELTQNEATGGVGGDGPGNAADGKPGQGVGGAVYILTDPDTGTPLSSVSLDAFTVNHAKRNKASTSDNNIYGQYTLIP